MPRRVRSTRRRPSEPAANAAKFRLPRPSRSFLLSSLSVALVLAGWVLVTEMGWANELFLPKPQAVWAAFVKTMTKGYQGSTLIQHVGTSLYRILTAFALACMVGIPLGVLMGVSRDARALLNPLIEFYRPLPPLGLYTLLVMWLGIGETSKLSLLFLAGLPGIVISTIQAVSTIDPVYMRAAQSLGATRRDCCSMSTCRRRDRRSSPACGFRSASPTRCWSPPKSSPRPPASAG